MDNISKIQDARRRCTGMPSSVAVENIGNCVQTDGFRYGYNNNILQHSVLVPTASTRVKNSWIAVDVDSLLCLGLGSSSSSSDSKGSSMTACTTQSTAKETEEASMGILLNSSLHLGNEDHCPKVNSSSQLKPFITQPEVDLELSLCCRTTESTITCLSPKSNRYAADTRFPAPQNYDAYDGAESYPVDARLSLSTLSGLECPSNTSNSQEAEKITNHTVHVPSVTSCLTILPKCPVNITSGVTQHQLLNTGSSKTCQVDGCGKGARGASGRCIAHGGGRRCQKPGCQKGAEGRTVYCKAHGGGRRCDFLGCTKSAEGRTDFCIAHGGGRRCSNEGCTRAARGKSGLCIRHGGGKRCQKENCTKSAEGLSGLCISHGGGRRCQYPECTKGAQGSTMYCKAHGGGKRCTYEGCSKGAEGSTPFCKGHGGGKRCSFQGGGVCSKSVHGGTQFCVAHGGGKRCGVKDCTKSARGRTAYCVRHGGGKRCKVEECGKSAQGSTDFCKAHGGGRRCYWGHSGSEFGKMSDPCFAFAIGNTGVCASHRALMWDKRVHGAGIVLPVVQDTGACEFEKSKDTMENDAIAVEGSHITPNGSIPIGWDTLTKGHEAAPPCLSDHDLVAEKRIYRGTNYKESLVSMLAGKGGHIPDYEGN